MSRVPLGSVEVDPAIPVPLDDAEEKALIERAGGLRVALLSDAIPGRNGVGTYYDDLSANLAEHVAAVRLFAPPSEPDPDYAGLQFRMPGDATQQLYLPSPSRLRDELTAFRPDVVVSATPWLYGVLSIRIARRVGAAVCIGYHTQIDRLLEMYWKRFGVGWIARRLVAVWDSLLFRFGDCHLGKHFPEGFQFFRIPVINHFQCGAGLQHIFNHTKNMTMIQSYDGNGEFPVSAGL